MKKITGYRNFGLLIGLIALLIVAAIVTPSMYSSSSLLSMFRNNAIYGLLAVGMMFVLITGGIDLSIGSTLSLAGVISAMQMSQNQDVPVIVWVFVGLLVGLICGLINGFLIGKLKMVPMIATLGTMYIYRGGSFLFSGGEWLFPHQFTESFLNISAFKILGINGVIWFQIIALVVAGIFMNYLSAGRRIFAIGTNVESAHVAGINDGNVKMIAYGICGALAGLSGMLYTSNYAMCSYSIGEGYEMTAIAICILGGVSITGGKGTIDGVIIGALMMSIITYFISLLPGLSIWKDAIQGAIIIVAVIINVITIKTEERRALKERGALI
jgi:Ribose/xylose/arabinose/galactoside ABC-type transport systems, permease components